MDASSVYLQGGSEQFLQPAVFPNPSGRFDGLVAGRRYLICGDPAVAVTTAAASSSSSSSIEPLLGLTPAYAGSSVSVRRSSSWAVFKSVVPRFALSRKAAPLREIKKSVDYRLVEVGLNNRLQLGEIKSSTFIRIAENEVSVCAFTEVVKNRLGRQIPDGEDIILVDNRVVPIPDDEGSRGEPTC